MPVRLIEEPPAGFPENHLETLLQCLSQANPRQVTNAKFEHSLEQALAKQHNGHITLPETFVIHPDDDQLFLSNQHFTELQQGIRQSEQKPLREIANFLQAVVTKREARGDLWPEGRLQLGVAYAELGEYAAARRVLDEVIRICESGGRFMDEQAIAA